MPDWDEDSSKLRENLSRILKLIARASAQREAPSLEAARGWQKLCMEGLSVSDQRFVGAFRGESNLKNVQVRAGANRGVDAANAAKTKRRLRCCWL